MATKKSKSAASKDGKSTPRRKAKVAKVVEPEVITPEDAPEEIAGAAVPEEPAPTADEAKTEKEDAFYARKHDNPLKSDEEIIAMGYKAGDSAMVGQDGLLPDQWGVSRPGKNDHPGFRRDRVIGG